MIIPTIHIMYTRNRHTEIYNSTSTTTTTTATTTTTTTATATNTNNENRVLTSTSTSNSNSTKSTDNRLAPPTYSWYYIIYIHTIINNPCIYIYIDIYAIISTIIYWHAYSWYTLYLLFVLLLLLLLFL